MELIKTTKNGTLYYQLKDGRLGAIYPDTGYARVSYAISKNSERAKRQREYNRKQIAGGRIGRMMKYQINPTRMVTEFKEINIPLYFKFDGKEIQYNGQTWRKAYARLESKERIKYPGDFSKLYTMLLAYETKNCQP